MDVFSVAMRPVVFVSLVRVVFACPAHGYILSAFNSRSARV